jgi:hypothetical protein
MRLLIDVGLALLYVLRMPIICALLAAIVVLIFFGAVAALAALLVTLVAGSYLRVRRLRHG